jgi:hypothetical protein
MEATFWGLKLRYKVEKISFLTYPLELKIKLEKLLTKHKFNF